MQLFKNKKNLRKLFDTLDFEHEFDTMLSFVSELCEVSTIFISIIGIDDQIIKAKIDFENLIVPENLFGFIDPIINKETDSIVSDSNENIVYPTNPAPFSFFAGFPIYINKNLVVGTLCIINKEPRKLSAIQLKSLDQAVIQIQSLLELHILNKKLQKKLKEKETQLEQFIDNSKEIFYELNLQGIIITASKNWFTFLGYNASEVIGKSNATLIHPDDLAICITYLKKLVETGESEKELIYRILHKEGYYLWHATSIKLSEKEGNLIYTGNCRDVTEHIEIQQKLIEQKGFYEKILDRLPTDVAVFDSNYRYIYLNPAAVKNDDLRKFIIGKDDFEYAKHTGRDDRFAKSRRVKFLQAVESRNLVEWEDSIERSDGQISYHTRKFNPVFHEDNTLEMMVGFGVNITESKRTQEEILKSKQLINSVIKNVAVGILVQGPQSEILYDNKAACEMLGLTEDQLLGKTSFDEHWRVIHLDGTNFAAEEHPVPQAIQKLKPINNIIMGVHRPLLNDLVWLLIDAIPVFGDADELLYVICSFNDITARKNAEDALKVSNERFTYSSRATSDALWDWNIISDEIFVGESYYILFGHHFKNNLITGLECENFIHSDDRANYIATIDKAINSNVYRWSGEYRYLKMDGTYAYVNDKAIIIRNNKGEAIRMIGAMQDITNEKKLRDELQQSEQQFKGAFEHSAVGMAIVNLEGHWIEVNNRLCEILGYSKEEFKILTFQEITYSEDLAEDLANKEKLVLGETSNFNMEKRYIHKNRSLVWVHLSVSLVRNNMGEIQHFIPQIIDITARKKIEEENKLLIDENNRNKTVQLNEAKNLYRLLADNTIDLVCLHNLDTSFQYVSPSIKKLLGYAPEDLIGKLPQEFVHPEDLNKLDDSIYSFISEMDDISVRLRFRNIEGEYFWFESKAILVKENGIPISFQSSTRDITQRKKAEEIIENTLIQERELNELRTNLVSTISHEFRTPMTTIRTSAELIAMYLEGLEPKHSIHIKKRINTITEEIDRIVELMNAVLTISKDD